nr:hypothetical protein [Tanacetum cinerariifolium]
HGIVGYPFDYHVTRGFSSIAGGIDHVNPIISLPLKHELSRVLGLDDYSNPSVGSMAGVDINTFTMEQYLALSRENQAPGVVNPEIRGNVNFEIKSQFMWELRENSFFRNKNKDAHDHVDRVLNIRKYVWIDSLQELSTLGTSLKKPLYKDQLEIMGLPRWLLAVYEIWGVISGCRVAGEGTGEMNSYEARTTNEAPSSSVRECKVVNNDHDTQHRPISFRKLNDMEEWATKEIQYQLPPKELNPGNFTQPLLLVTLTFTV